MNKKEYRRFAFRTNAFEIAEWARAAARNQKPLSVFIRDAAHAAKAGIAGDELNFHLLAIRSMLNAALHVRTDEQKKIRVTQARDQLTALIHRKGIISNDF